MLLNCQETSFGLKNILLRKSAYKTKQLKHQTNGGKQKAYGYHLLREHHL